MVMRRQAGMQIQMSSAIFAVLRIDHDGFGCPLMHGLSGVRPHFSVK